MSETAMEAWEVKSGTMDREDTGSNPWAARHLTFFQIKIYSNQNSCYSDLEASDLRSELVFLATDILIANGSSKFVSCDKFTCYIWHMHITSNFYSNKLQVIFNTDFRRWNVSCTEIRTHDFLTWPHLALVISGIFSFSIWSTASTI